MSNSIRFMGINLSKGKGLIWEARKLDDTSPWIAVLRAFNGTWMASVDFRGGARVTVAVFGRASRRAALDALRKEIKALHKSLGELKI